ncbi:hypothetical protein C0Q70_09323 [Pomacea canaliculata]|uniref:Peroxidase n=1 Tax=Pomacea canaliculata TaxID=400727 RepID=A0A2T7P9G8_POMCA|nr:hypothetical protein C0Q70_09323 [Pomacea canaliculata]
MSLTAASVEQLMQQVIVYNKQGDAQPLGPLYQSGFPSVFTTVSPITTTPAPNSPESNLRCQSSVELKCDPELKFRTPDGTCNNLVHNLWGSALSPLRRILQPQYGDGEWLELIGTRVSSVMLSALSVSAPRTTSTHSRNPLPSARAISVLIHPSGPGNLMTSLTHMVMQWGQYLDHDITSTPIQTGELKSNITYYTHDYTSKTILYWFIFLFHRTACFPIPIPSYDPYFKGRSCFSFTRSLQVTNSNCKQVPVEQLNQLTAYVDASQVYGSSAEEQKNLRTFKGGQMTTSGNDLLPKDKAESCVLNNPNRDYCFKAGDLRVNEQMGLASMHTVWMREHNRLVQKMAAVNPHWNDERLFQETRKIVGALYQKITYGDWLPIVLDRNRFAANNLQLLPSGQQSNIYNPSVDAGVKNVFASAAFRFGHSLIRSTMSQYAKYVFIYFYLNETFQMSTSTVIVTLVVTKKVDRFFTEEIKNHLFQDKRGNSLDLVAFNIQRGRDHGLPPYNEWRKYCKLPVMTSFSNMPDHDELTGQAFSQIYEHPDDIDLFSGAISERPEGNGLVGPTFACILSEQFRNLKFGDRFWFETRDPVTGFSLEQLEEIRRHSLARVICANTGGGHIQGNPFVQPSDSNPMVNCNDLPDMTMEPWREVQGRARVGTWTEWGEWSACDQGMQLRQRACSQYGECAGNYQDSQPCASPGWTSQWSQWSPWSTCFQGLQARSRACSGQPATGFGSPCPGGPQETRPCSSGTVGWAQWGPWGTVCSQGRQWRERTCTRSPNQVGVCSGPSSQSKPCTPPWNYPWNNNGNPQTGPYNTYG